MSILRITTTPSWFSTPYCPWYRSFREQLRPRLFKPHFSDFRPLVINFSTVKQGKFAISQWSQKNYQEDLAVKQARAVAEEAAKQARAVALAQTIAQEIRAEEAAKQARAVAEEAAKQARAVALAETIAQEIRAEEAAKQARAVARTIAKEIRAEERVAKAARSFTGATFSQILLLFSSCFPSYPTQKSIFFGPLPEENPSNRR